MLKTTWSLLFITLTTLLLSQGDVNYSPQTVVYNHLNNLQLEAYKPEEAAKSFPITDQKKAEKAARQLKQILDGNGIYISVDDIPEKPDYKDSIEKKAIYYIDSKFPSIYLEKVNGKWYYSRETISVIPDLYNRLYPLGFHLDTYFTAPFWKSRFLALQTWQWLCLFLLMLVSFVLYVILSLTVRELSKIIFFKWLGKDFFNESNFVKGVRVFSWYLVVRVTVLLLPSLQLPAKFNMIFIRGLEILGIFLLVFVLVRLVSAIFSYLEKLAEQTENTMDDQLLPVIRKIIKVLIWVVGAIFILAQLKVNITALLAGLSIGGLAMALAAQDTVKNFFGSVMIFLDRPFQIGDWIHFDDVDGVVEEVGIRSTRIRTFSNSLTYVPNAHLANVTVDNMGLRKFRRYKTEIGVTYDTPPEVIDLFVEGIKEIIKMHPTTRKDYFEVSLNSFGSNSLNILLYMFFEASNWSDELKGRHEVMYAIIKLANECGVRFAFPTQTIHIEDFPGQKSLTPQAIEPISYEKKAKTSLKEIKQYFNQLDPNQKDVKPLGGE